MSDGAFGEIVGYAAETAQGPYVSSDAIRKDLRPLIQAVLDEVATEIATAWGNSDARPEGLAFALGYLHTRYGGHRV